LNGPKTPSASPNTLPVRGIRPCVGFNPAMPVLWHGCLMLPPPSEPTLRAAPPAATSAADPPLLPPGVRDKS
jgi:hypothetical protein